MVGAIGRLVCPRCGGRLVEAEQFRFPALNRLDRGEETR